MRSSLWLLPLLLGCTGEPAKPPPPPLRGPAPAEIARIEGERLQVDPSASHVTFTGRKLTRSHEGGFQRFEGYAVVGDQDELRALAFEIDATSVWTDTEKLTRHLKDEDFFWVEEHPTVTFTSVSIANGVVTGSLDLRGVTQEISFPITLVAGVEALVLSAELSLDRQRWGLRYNGLADDLIEDQVPVRVELRFPRG